MALLLTNVDGFRAQVVLESGESRMPNRPVTGELMGRGGKLLFAPAPTGGSKKRIKAEDSAFIWDVAQSRGWVLNEPLQAYAPISSPRQYTNVAVGPAPAASGRETISGHPCQSAEMTVTASDGVGIVFNVWRATDLNGLPLRIHCPSNGLPATLTLLKPRLEAVPFDLFQPPNGFTRYESPEAMMAELFLRKHNLGRKPIFQPDEYEAGMGSGTRVPTRP